MKAVNVNSTPDPRIYIPQQKTRCLVLAGDRPAKSRAVACYVQQKSQVTLHLPSIQYQGD